MPQMRWLIVACRLIYSFPKSKASHPRTVLFYKLSGSRTMAATVLLLLSFRCCSLHAIKSLVIDIIHVLLQGCCWNPPFNLSLCVNNRVLCTKPRRNGKRFSWFSDLFWKICWNAWKWDYNSFHLSWPDLLYIYMSYCDCTSPPCIPVMHLDMIEACSLQTRAWKTTPLQTQLTAVMQAVAGAHLAVSLMPLLITTLPLNPHIQRWFESV